MCVCVCALKSMKSHHKVILTETAGGEFHFRIWVSGSGSFFSAHLQMYKITSTLHWDHFNNSGMG